MDINLCDQALNVHLCAASPNVSRILHIIIGDKGSSYIILMDISSQLYTCIHVFTADGGSVEMTSAGYGIPLLSYTQ